MLLSVPDLYDWQKPSAAALKASLAAHGVAADGSDTGCHARGTEILMYDGSVRRVETLRVGEIIMGWDNTPRPLLSLSRGREGMFRVVPTKGDAFTVNRSHVLTVVDSDPRTGNRVTDVTAEEFNRWAPTLKTRNKLFRVAVDWPEAPVPLDPYFLGLLLGDGGLRGRYPTLNKPDREIRETAVAWAATNGVSMFTVEDSSCPSHVFTGKKLIGILESLGLWYRESSGRFVPQEYKANSREVRLQILAGLLDTDGHLSCGGYDFISASRWLSRDVAFLARSLGLAAYVSPSHKLDQHGNGGVYWRVSISGGCSLVPCRIPRRKAPMRRQKKDVLRTGFHLEELPADNFYGFSIPGDGRYVLGDFTVTHNTGKTYKVCRLAHEALRPLVVICPKSVVPEWERVAKLFDVPCTAINYEKVRTGKSGLGVWMVKGKTFEWNVPNEAILVFDEAHKLGGQGTQNSTLLIAAKRQKLPTLLLSATLIGSPLKAYAIGFALGLHNLLNYWKWARANGVTDGYFGVEWKPKNAEAIMQSIRVALGDKFTRIRKADVPDFPQCQNIPTFVHTPERKGFDFGEDYSVAARQEVELLKVPGLVEKTKELVDDEGMSVAIFVSFRATLAALQEEFPKASVVWGGQTPSERQRAIDSFQANETHVILLMSQAGGTGVSLHDLKGRSRAALICPGYDAVEFLQTLGRIHRAGALSPAINYLVFASGVPVERRIRNRLEAKLTNLSALNDHDLSDQETPKPHGSDNHTAHPPGGPQAPELDDADPVPGDAHQHRGDRTHGTSGHSGRAFEGDSYRNGSDDRGGNRGGRGMSAPDVGTTQHTLPVVIDVQATVITTDQQAATPAAKGEHSERKHARCSPSKLKNLEICPSYEPDNDAPVHPVTLRGTAMHEALETNNDSLLLDEEHPLVAMCREAMADDLAWAVEVIQEAHLKTHDKDVQGFVDMLLLGPVEQRVIAGKPKAYRRAKIRDYKMGWNLVDLPDVNPQAIAYTVGVFLQYPTVEEISFAFLIPRCDAILEHTFYRHELAALKLRLSTIADRVRKLGGTEFNKSNDNCLYCGRKHLCPAVIATALPLANAIAAEDRLPLPPVLNLDQITEPQHLAWLLNLANVAESFAEQAKRFALRYRLELGQEIPGYDLIERRPKREITNPVDAFVVAKEFGVTETEFLSASKISVTQLDDLVKNHATEGKAETLAQFADRLSDVNALSRGASFHVLQRSKKKKALPAA